LTRESPGRNNTFSGLSKGFFLKIITSLVKRIDNFSERSGKIISWLVLVLVGLTVYEVFTRRVLGSPTIWTHEILAYVFGAHFMLAFGYTLLHKGHVNVDLIVSRFSPKTQAILEIVNFFLFIGLFCAIWLWLGTIYAKTSWEMLEKAPTAFFSPVYPAKTIIPIAVFLLALQAIGDLIRNIVFVVKGVRL